MLSELPDKIKQLTPQEADYYSSVGNQLMNK